MAGHQVEDPDPRSLWFIPPDDGESSRPTLTRERVVAEALTVISMDGAEALSMRGLARRLGVVPGALYRHVRSKEQLHDLVLYESGFPEWTSRHLAVRMYRSGTFF